MVFVMRNFKINNLPKHCVPVPYRCIVCAPDINGQSPYHFEFYARNHRYIIEWCGVNSPRLSYMVSIDVPFHPLNKKFQI